MNIFKSLSLFTVLAISSCFAQGAANNIDSSKKVDNSNYVIGDINNAIATFVFKEIENGSLEKKIIFYVDKFPYEARFNLCEPYEKNLAQCNSRIKILNLAFQKVPYFVNYSFVFPQTVDHSSNKILEKQLDSIQNISVNKEYRFESLHYSNMTTFEMADK